ncbi:MAG: alpha-keto acid decarboxylase family protein [Candidatus Jettenia sp.]|uniref:Putative indole-3-pyruvate decarboxylase n=1 Tax=Candidatus Jettenia caeni TaxID=247490 RepID=I3IJT0_9BACT|nr:thiamine pyrophosphate-binding protein [Candidatus Jettenia sp. AMX1]MBC6927768.1 alpha-keto acid decarboxylase family protein [Candidatus Jettenia sp.]NUN23839.1 alpha-keto acid decarboxylase family protein [Candidatus Jettenia caeni]KAA0250317.1 MAG: alpha-keto acid decarboxylase family protein [Candidatus Jettenia sp. AMX1]MCE7879489.1 alpha-keto acid decarboxylase family protein [Candidatus Jettenia sp. AMX1]MCQ3926089.1 alpha-keto acid decarboxylase family protein [Candidatus Jettenia 
MEMKNTLGNYLIEQLYNCGARHVFGVAGDYVLRFFDDLVHSKLNVICTCDEQGAGYAADAYARLNGLGVVCITYCVGGLKVVNPVAQAYAEKSPVVVISGAPGIKERKKNPMLHHKVRDFDTQKKIFDEVTVASTVLSDPGTAPREIDRVLNAAQRYKRPVYIELPRDMTSEQVTHQYEFREMQEKSDPVALQEAVTEAITMIHAAKKPVIIAGVELQRFGLQSELVKFIEKTNIPVTSLLLSKSVISERHPLYLGLYEGAIGHDFVREYVESSDCLVLLGALLTDINLGAFTAHLDQGRMIYVTSEKTAIRHHNYENIYLQDFMYELMRANIKRQELKGIQHQEVQPFSPVKGQKVTVQRLFQCLNSFLTDDTVVIADVGDALVGGSDLVVHRRTEFISPAYYLSLGFAVPASIGAQLASPSLRPLVLVGDGAFQMTGMELSTIVRYHLNPIVVVFNNYGYGIERPMMDGPFNDLQLWQYSRIPEIIGGGRGFIVKTEEQLSEALEAAEKYKDGFCILDVHLDKYDMSPALQRLTSLSAKRAR